MFRYLEKLHGWAAQQLWNPAYRRVVFGLVSASTFFLVLGLLGNVWAAAIGRVLVGLSIAVATPPITPKWGKTAIIRYGAACLFVLSAFRPGLDEIALLIMIVSGDSHDDFPPLRRMPKEKQQSKELRVPGVLRGA